MTGQYLDRYAGAEFEPYVTALGKFALAWNELQRNLCELFSIVTLERRPRAGDMVNVVPTRVWYSIKSDRSQRDMLEAAITHSKLSEGNELVASGKWLCTKVGLLENRRNDILHSPLILYHQGKDTRTIIPNTFSGSPRAKALADTDSLLEEFWSARHNAILLSDYAQGLVTALLNARAPWPNKPSLQGRRPKQTTGGPTPTPHK
jgi:hypothetical protein